VLLQITCYVGMKGSGMSSSGSGFKCFSKHRRNLIGTGRIIHRS
jgi:hypothetical protein